MYIFGAIFLRVFYEMQRLLTIILTIILKLHSTFWRVCTLVTSKPMGLGSAYLNVYKFNCTLCHRNKRTETENKNNNAAKYT